MDLILKYCVLAGVIITLVCCIDLCQEPPKEVYRPPSTQITRKQDIQKPPSRVPAKSDNKGKWSTWEM